MNDMLRATPFHARAVEANRLNAWESRAGFTLASHYGVVEEETVAARFGAVLADISWYWRAAISGARAGELVSRFFTRNASALGVGAALDALWLNDAGAVRGAGSVIREERDGFVLVSAQEDMDWLAGAADLYDVTVRESSAQGVLSLVGPASARILSAAGLDANLPPLAKRRRQWRGLEVSLSRLGMGFEIWCEADDALIVWDRLMAAGRPFALVPVGQIALDTIEFESGIMRPGREFTPARDGFAPQPSPQSLGLCALVDRTHMFNGRSGYLAGGPDTTLWGVLLDGETPIAGTPLHHEGRAVGRTLGARYSPALQQVIAFALLDEPLPAGDLKAGTLSCRPTGLPFLPIPSPMGTTESATLSV